MMLKTFRSIALLLVVASTAFAEAPVTDWQRTLDGAFWSWSEEAASPLYCAMRQSDVPVTIDVTKGKSGIVLSVGGYQRSIHEHTVFEVRDGMLYLAVFLPSANGATIVAIDLKTGEKKWESPVKGIGPVQHSAYSN